MWFAVAILGIIAIACGITLLPNGKPATNSPPPPSVVDTPTAPPSPAAPAPGAPANH